MIYFPVYSKNKLSFLENTFGIYCKFFSKKINQRNKTRAQIEICQQDFKEIITLRGCYYSSNNIIRKNLPTEQKP